MSLAYALTTVARQKIFSGISGTTYDTILDYIVDSATDWIEGYCDIRFKETTYTNQEYDGTGSTFLQLKHFPVSSSAAFTLQKRDTATNENNWSTIESDLYFVNNSAGIVKLVSGEDFLTGQNGDVFLKIPNHYRVTYTAGYAFDNAATFLSTVGAADLEYAIWKLANAAFLQRKSSGNIQSERIGDYDVTFTKEAMMDDEVKEILSKYRRFPG